MTEPVPTPRGASVPDFTSRNQHGETVRAADLRGRPALIVFYPWAFSGICTGELADLKAGADRIAATGARVLAVSCDAMFTLRAYADAQDLPFELLTDHWPHGAIARSFGVFDETAGAALRGSFAIDPDGIVRWTVLHGIGEPRDIEAHLTALAAL
ncbi:peroxiredoxin [Microlunatus ginsengisoli]|uniref:Peroxiredoxin n=1 Tax=Microlunatus ginsengisoli TaxID=363863 RepID=A0ABP6ZAB2_9ACTN